MELHEVFLGMSGDRREVEKFLEIRGLSLDGDVEFTVLAVEGETVLGTGSLAGPVLKCIAVEPAHQGMGVAAAIVSRLVTEAYDRGKRHLFIYTIPQNEELFRSLGFFVVERMIPDVVLLEDRPSGFISYLDGLKRKRREGEIVGAVVVNCNPFTLGHRYLLETASSRCDTCHVFVVQEDRSVFPFEVRYALVRKGTRDLKNLVLHRGGSYIISSATFPSYFLKEPGAVVDIHARFDVMLFGGHIAAVLGITRRFVGDEPYCRVTNRYNEIMAELLPRYGMELEIVPRLEKGGAAVSASSVRKLLAADALEDVKKLVPPSTWEYLRSKEAEPVIRALKAKAGERH